MRNRILAALGVGLLTFAAVVALDSRLRIGSDLGEVALIAAVGAALYVFARGR